MPTCCLAFLKRKNAIICFYKENAFVRYNLQSCWPWFQLTNQQYIWQKCIFTQAYTGYGLISSPKNVWPEIHRNLALHFFWRTMVQYLSHAWADLENISSMNNEWKLSCILFLWLYMLKFSWVYICMCVFKSSIVLVCGCNSVIDVLTSICKILGSIPPTTKVEIKG